jgi:hypothetical protein
MSNEYNLLNLHSQAYIIPAIVGNRTRDIFFKSMGWAGLSLPVGRASLAHAPLGGALPHAVPLAKHLLVFSRLS